MQALDIAQAVLAGLPWTVVLTLASFLVGACLAIPLCLLRTSRQTLISGLAGSLILLVRSIPPIVWLFVMFFAFGQYVVRVEPFTAAIMGLSLITAVNMAEIYRGALQAIPQGQHEAAYVIGLSAWQRYRDVIAPQVFRYALPAASTYAIGLLKETAIASVIGVPEIAQIANQLTQKTFKGLEIYAIAAVLYFALSFLMAALARWLDASIRQRIGT